MDDNVLEPQTNNETQAQSPDVEKRARDMGWVPENEWKGEPPRNGFKSAEDYVKYGEEMLPIVRSQLKRAETQNTELRDRVSKMETEHRETIKRIERMSSVALAEQRKQIEAHYTERKEAAVEVGDKEAFRKADKEEKEAIKAIDEKLAESAEDKDKKTNGQIPASVQQTLDAWMDENRWFGADEEAKGWATGYHGKLLKEKPGLTLRENLNLVSEQARKRFPELFGEVTDDGDDDVAEQPRRRSSPVEGGSRVPSGNGRSLASKLPADAKAQASKFIKDDGLFLEKGETVEKDFNKALERYAASYFEGDAR